LKDKKKHYTQKPITYVNYQEEMARKQLNLNRLLATAHQFGCDKYRSDAPYWAEKPIPKAPWSYGGR